MKKIDKIKLWFTDVNKLEAVNDKLFLYKNYLVDKDKNVLLYNINHHYKFDDKHIVKSKILDMYNAGSFTPYSEKNLQDLIDVCVYYKTHMNSALL
jgi:hypothetical protein